MTRIVLIALAWVLVALGAVLWGAAGWIRRTFGPISVDQMLMHLPGAGGAETTGAESGYIGTFVWQALVLPLGAVLLLGLLLLGIRAAVRGADRRRASGRYAVPPRKSWLRRGVESASGALRARTWAPALLSIGVFVLGGAVFAQSVNLPQYVASFFTKLTIDDYYAAPDEGADAMSTVALTDGSGVQSMNLVTIFLESGETAFDDESLFGLNMNAPVERATAGWDSFDKLEKFEGGGWTMAGIVGTECGIPLRGLGLGDLSTSSIGDGEQNYLSGISCIGDVLSEAGYTGVFMGGADAEFASKGSYLRSHGYSEVYDLNYWEAQGETERSFWGLSDRRLMENAKAEVTRLHETGQPFHLSLLTVDSHEPATLFDGCPQQTDEPLGSIIFCSMEAVAGFIDYMRDQGYLDDTVVFLTGDHPKQFGEIGIYMDELSTLDEHPLFNRLWVPGEQPRFERNEIDQLSVGATLLDVLGLGREDGRFGLGFSALRPVTRASGAVALSAEDYRSVLTSRSTEFYVNAWGISDDATIEAGDPLGADRR